MTEIVRFTVPGEPTAKGRARSFVRNGHVAHYTPEKTARYENLVKLAAQQAMQGRAPVDGPLRLTVHAFFSIPASWSAKKRAAAVGKPVIKKPDASNILKAIEDGMNGVVYIDDAQCAILRASKSYAEQPRVEIVVEAA